MYDEDDLLPISALQHLAFCERQWGLMFLEGIWSENILTAEGSILHERAHEQETEVRDNLRITRGLRLKSLRHGLTGVADVVEFHRITDNSGSDANETMGVQLDGVTGRWSIFPVEYKHGKPKIDRCDEVQLCGQVLCLEEMLDTCIESGAIFYGQPRRRYGVTFDESLRLETEELAVKLHELTKAAKTPVGKYEKKCRSCSLLSHCLPKATAKGKSAKRYLDNTIADTLKEEE